MLFWWQYTGFSTIKCVKVHLCGQLLDYMMPKFGLLVLNAYEQSTDVFSTKFHDNRLFAYGTFNFFSLSLYIYIPFFWISWFLLVEIRCCNPKILCFLIMLYMETKLFPLLALFLSRFSFQQSTSSLLIVTSVSDSLCIHPWSLFTSSGPSITSKISRSTPE